MAARRPPVLLGRAGEREALDRLLENVRGGQSAVAGHPRRGGRRQDGPAAPLRSAGIGLSRRAGSPASSPRWSCRSRGCISSARRCSTGSTLFHEPQQGALRVALGLASGAAPDRFLVALAALSLLAEVAGERPLLCFVDDAQWLDAASAQVLGFVARRLLAESVAIVFAVRDPTEERELAGLPELTLAGLPERGRARPARDGHPGPARRARPRPVRRRDARQPAGDPGAAAGAGRDAAARRASGSTGQYALPGRIEESFLQRLEALPAQARLLLLVAAAEPVDDPLLVWRAAERLGIGFSAAAADATEGLLAIGERVMFRHPLVRSAVYRSATLQERHAVHLALAEATDPQVDPDRRAWHLAQASTAPDERVAMELERSAARAQARGGLGAAAAFLERGRDAVTGPVPPSHAAAGGGQRQARCRCARRRTRDCSARSMPRRSTSSDAPASRCCTDRSPSISSAPARRRGMLAGAARRLEPAGHRPGAQDAPRGARRRDVRGRPGRPGRDADHRGGRAARAPAARLARGERRAARGLRAALDRGAPSRRAVAAPGARARARPRPSRRTTTATGCGSPSPATPSRSPRSCGTPMPGVR